MKPPLPSVRRSVRCCMVTSPSSFRRPQILRAILVCMPTRCERSISERVLCCRSRVGRSAMVQKCWRTTGESVVSDATDGDLDGRS
jgi:hypothetical protein